MKSSLEDNDAEMISTHNKGKSVFVYKFIRTLKNKIYKYMIPILKNVYIDKLADIVNEYNNTYYSAIKMKAADVTSSTYIHFEVENNNKDPKFEGGYHLIVTKYKKNAKGYTPNWSEEDFMITKVKNTEPWTYVTEKLNEKELQKKNQIEFRAENVIKIKGDKLYVKWKGNNNSFNSWIDKKDIFI